jgi:4-hydroxy-tetrahydrodipicolinate synthase
VIADLQVALFRAVKAGDLHRAQAINDRMYPIVSAFYSDPFVDMHNRMKETLVLLGRLEKAVVRPPLVKLPQSQIDMLARAVAASRLSRGGAFAEAAE